MTSNTITLRNLKGEPLGFKCPNGLLTDHQMGRLKELIAHDFLCRPEEVEFEEGTGRDDEGLEYLTVYGERVAYLDDGSGRTPSLIPFAQAAE
jgi:hypothetical protein